MDIIKRHGNKIDVKGRCDWYSLEGDRAKKFLKTNNINMKFFMSAKYDVVLSNKGCKVKL